MQNDHDKEKNIVAFQFAKNSIPERVETLPPGDDTYVSDGMDNLHSYSELKWYNNCPIHASIINHKANYIIGKGLKIGDNPLDIMVNPSDSMSEFLEKIVLDLLIHSRFSVEVCYNIFNQPIEYHHVPVFKVRPNKSKSKFWFSDDWRALKRPTKYERFKANPSENKSRMFYFDLSAPGETTVYPNPEYQSTVRSIETDIAIREFNYNNIKNHFSVSTLITFFMGTNADPAMKKAALDEIKRSFSGENGNKIMLDFQSQDGKSADVKNLSPGEWDKAYDIISRKVTEDILSGHSIVSPILFGVKTEGQLGATQEQRDAYNIWKDNYVAKRRNQIQSALNMMFEGFEKVKGKIEFIDKPLPTEMTDALKEKIMFINEIRKEQGLSPIANGDRFIGESAPQATVAPQPAQPVPTAMSKQLRELSEEDFEKIKDFGEGRDDFEFMGEGEFVFSTEHAGKVELKFETQQEIADYLVSKKLDNISVAELKVLIRKDLGINVSASELSGYLTDIHKAGILNIEDNDGQLNIKPSEAPSDKSKQIQVVYSYEVREGRGAPIIDTTRPFCRRLIQNDRVYTRAEIQRMSGIFGYDVFELGGGYFWDEAKREATKHCRHKWKAYSVARRPKKTK